MASDATTLKQCNEALQNLSADLEMFAHIMSHDLKDPLRQALIDCKESSIVKVEASIEFVIRRIELLREFSYIVNTKQINEEMCDLKEVFVEAKQQLGQVITASKATIEVSELPTVKGNKLYLIRLFKELLDNALRYVEKGTAPHIIVSAEQKEGYHHISITDNGIGFDPVYKKLIFALFQKIDPYSNTMGAGLTFCKKIVEKHGGSIELESQEGEGSTFFFMLKAEN